MKIKNPQPKVLCDNQKYDSETNTIVREFYDGSIQWLDPIKGAVIHEKNNNTNEEIFYDYDDKGALIHFKDNIGNEKWFYYNSTGGLDHIKYSNGIEVYYDILGNVINICEQAVSFREGGLVYGM